MRILHLEASTGWGGQEIRILKEAEGMRKRGHDVVFAIAKGGVLATRGRNAGFIVYELNFHKLHWPITIFSLLRILWKHKIDLLNTHSSLDSWIGGIAARMTAKKIVRTRHLSTPIKAGVNSRLLYGYLADFVVTTCQAIVAPISIQSKKPLEKCRSIATGVDPSVIHATDVEALSFRQKLHIAPADFLVGTACVMRSWKGIDDLLKAADQLRHIENLKWVIIGGGHAERHHRFAKELKLENIVYFTGHLDNPFAALKALDAFALLSTANEGVSQAILQAAFLEKPLIATPTGGLGEVCIDQQTGFTVEPFSPHQVAQAVKQLYASPALCKQLGMRGRTLVLERFTLDQTLDQMEKVYEEIQM